MLGVAVIGLMWRYLLDPSFGVVNGLLNVVGLPAVPWITAQPWAWISLVGGHRLVDDRLQRRSSTWPDWATSRADQYEAA